MRLAITHRYRFAEASPLVGEELAGAERWDALRTQTHGAFALAATRAAQEARADADETARRRAEALDAVIGDRTVASYGAGTGITELWLKRLRPSRRVVIGEFAPLTALRLGEVMPDVQVALHDFLVDEPLPADLHLFFRVDTELTNAAFAELLHRFAARNVVVVATELLGPRALARELATRLRRGTTRAGLVRTRGVFESLWAPTHDAHRLRIADLDGWLLEPRRPNGG